MVLHEVFTHFAGAGHLWLDIDDPLHDLLILTIDSLCLSFLGDVIKRFRGPSFHLEILLVCGTVFPL